MINFLSKHIKFECIKEGSLYLVVARIPNSNDKLNLARVDNMGPKDTMKWHLRFGQCNIQTLLKEFYKASIHEWLNCHFVIVSSLVSNISSSFQ